MPITLDGSCAGQAYFLVLPDGAGGSTVMGRFAGVHNNVMAMTDRMFTETHLKAERGGLSFPFPRGTGWPGLKALLEGR